jgi:hypothetical protein
VRARDGYNFDDTLTIQGFYEMLNEPVPGGRTETISGINLFIIFCHQVPWQYDKI